MANAQVAGLGLEELFLIALVTLLPLGLMALFVLGTVRLASPRRTAVPQSWPLAEDASPLHARQAIATRLGSLGVTAWEIQVDHPARTVTVVLSRPVPEGLDDRIRRALAPLDVEIVLHEGHAAEWSRLREDERPG